MSLLLLLAGGQVAAAPSDPSRATLLVAPDARTRRRFGLGPLIFRDPTGQAPATNAQAQSATVSVTAANATTQASYPLTWPLLIAPDARTRRRFGLRPLVITDPTAFPQVGGFASTATVSAAASNAAASIAPNAAQAAVTATATDATAQASYPLTWPFLVAPDARTRRRFGLGPLLFADPTGQVAPRPPDFGQAAFLTAPDARTRRRFGRPPFLLEDTTGPAAPVAGTANAQTATVTATANDAAASIAPVAGQAAVTVTATNATTQIAPTPSTATVAVTATDASTTGDTSAYPITATVSVTAADAQTGAPTVAGSRYPTVHRHLETTWTLGSLTHETWVIDQPQDRKRRNLIALILLGVI